MRVDVMKNPCRLVASVAAAAVLAACSTAPAGPNAGVAGAQAAADVPLATRPGVGQEVSAVAANRIEVLFPRGATVLTPAAARQLDLAARLFRDANPVLMFVAGYSDKAGDEYANLILSARRAQTVKRALVARGIPQTRLLLQAYGESEPKANDADDRRVVVTWRLL